MMNEQRRRGRRDLHDNRAPAPSQVSALAPAAPRPVNADELKAIVDEIVALIERKLADRYCLLPWRRRWLPATDSRLIKKRIRRERWRVFRSIREYEDGL